MDVYDLWTHHARIVNSYNDGTVQFKHISSPPPFLYLYSYHQDFQKKKKAIVFNNIAIPDDTHRKKKEQENGYLLKKKGEKKGKQ